MGRSWLWTLVGMVALAALSYGLFLWLAPPPLPEGFLYGNGRIEATEVVISAEVTGTVFESHLVEGRTVAAGDLLVRLDDADLRTRLKQAEAGALAAERRQAQVAQQLGTWRHHLETAASELERYRSLRATGAVAQEIVDQAEDRNRDAQGQVAGLELQQAEAEARHEAARREVELIDSRIARTTIRAPIAGTLLTKGIEVGELATPGRTVAVLADLTRLELKVFIPVGELPRIQLGDPARVRVDAFPDRWFEAHVARIDPRAQFTPKDVHMPDERARLVFGVTLAMEGGEGRLHPGMPADAWIRWQPEAVWPQRLPVPR
jgi:HlyD family secretion protein